MKLRAMLVVAACSAICVTAGDASATVVYETEPAFCEREVLHDYLAPLERMPKLHEPSSTGRVGFGPAGLRLQPLSPLLVGEGTVGYKLSLQHAARTVHLDWDATTTVARVDWRGRTTQVIDLARRHLALIRQ